MRCCQYEIVRYDCSATLKANVIIGIEVEVTKGGLLGKMKQTDSILFSFDKERIISTKYTKYTKMFKLISIPSMETRQIVLRCHRRHIRLEVSNVLRTLFETLNIIYYACRRLGSMTDCFQIFQICTLLESFLPRNIFWYL